MSVNIPHKFEVKTFFKPTMCCHCGQLIFGFRNQGVRCSACGLSAHKKCMHNIPNTCGTDVGRLAELLKDIQTNDPSNPKVLVPSPVAQITNDNGDTMGIYQSFVENINKDDEQEDIYSLPSEYIAPPTSIPKPKERTTTVAKRNAAERALRVDNFKFEVVLGRGSFGKVMLASIGGCSTRVAIKAMKKHTVIANGDVLATAVEKKMLELGLGLAIYFLSKRVQTNSRIKITNELRPNKKLGAVII